MQDALAASGQPLDAALRQEMESRFGHNFADVRVHSDATAAGSARSLNARAYTVGQDIVLGQRPPTADSGRQLLAHELAHVVQQSRGGPVPPLRPSAPHERDARMAERAVTARLPSVPVASPTGVGIALDGPTGAPPERPASDDPRLSPKYIDHLDPSWEGHGTYSFRIKAHGGPAEKDEARIVVPAEDIVRDEARSFVAIFEVHDSRDEALKKVKEWSRDAPGTEFYSFYRGPGGVILPTVFSKDSTPVFHAVLLAFEEYLVEQTAAEIEDMQAGLQSLANVVNPIPGTEVDEEGDLKPASDPMSYIPLLKLKPARTRIPKKRLKKIKRRFTTIGIKFTVHGYEHHFDAVKGLSVYVLRDGAGEVLYVGHGDIFGGRGRDGRLKEHIGNTKNRQDPYWGLEVAEVEIYATDLTKNRATALEEDLFHELKPRHGTEEDPYKGASRGKERGPDVPPGQPIFRFEITMP